MRKLIYLSALSLVPALTSAEVCVQNLTGLPESSFEFEFIKNPTIDRSNPKMPTVTSPKLFFSDSLGDQETECIDADMSGYLALFVKFSGQEATDQFFITKDTVNGDPSGSVVLQVIKPAVNTIKVKKLIIGKSTPVPLEKVYGLPK